MVKQYSPLQMEICTLLKFCSITKVLQTLYTALLQSFKGLTGFCGSWMFGNKAIKNVSFGAEGS